MKGKAPNCSAMGSQTRVAKKFNPNLWRGRLESCQSWRTNKSVTSTTDEAKRNVTMRAISSPLRRREINEREPAEGLAPGTIVVEVATVFAYWIESMAFSSLATTSLGNLA